MERLPVADRSGPHPRTADNVVDRSMPRSLQWRRNAPLPKIENHSHRKLDVLRNTPVEANRNEWSITKCPDN